MPPVTYILTFVATLINYLTFQVDSYGESLAYSHVVLPHYANIFVKRVSNLLLISILILYKHLDYYNNN